LVRVIKAFEFIEIEDLPPKPRDKGLTEIRESYYVVVTPTYLRELFETAGDYIVIFKYAGGSMRLHPRRTMLKINRLCHNYWIMVSTGSSTTESLVLWGSDD
jgi:phosphosulfolactate synthase (CoM biosynthesis protein A)